MIGQIIAALTMVVLVVGPMVILHQQHRETGRPGVRLSRRALLNEIATLTAQRDHAIQQMRDTITHPHIDLDPNPVLTANVRLAHQLEQTEQRASLAEHDRDLIFTKLQRLRQNHPALFAEGPR